MTTPYEDLRADFGDDAQAFTDVELDRIWNRVANASDTETQMEAALALMYRQALGKANSLHSYSAGGTSHNMNQVWEHYQTMYEKYEPSLKKALGRSGVRIAAIGLNVTEEDDA